MVEIKTQKNLNLSYLYENYYLKKSYSKQTSSYWRKYGEFQKVESNFDDYKLKGVLFGDFENRSFLKLIKNIPTLIYLKKLLKNCKKEFVKNIIWVAKKSGRRFSYDCARQALTLNRLNKNINNLDSKVFCIIGDGYGCLGCLLKKTFPNSKIIFINLGRTLFFDVYYSQKVFSNYQHKIITKSNTSICKDFNYIEAEKLSKLKFSADIFINIASMQEMNLKDIKSYFDIFRNQKKETWFYCCNRESKELPDGKITNFDNYPWLKSDIVLFDEICPWHKQFPQNRPPFIVKFEKHRHKLIKISHRITKY